ncbi:snaclec macrovipecetin subunit beta-like [Lampris incognitus]|uniref:snaclec macrovipecetin subunit beta-like n=1 Tax=Lampris incognitus TaxID=2546036 RepID=UPI0024B5765D|nr:snaclec macrovipecetin subunit beta-like [Lampris incognitus]
MKTVLIFSSLLCVVLSVTDANVPAEAAPVKEEGKSGSVPEVEAESAVVAAGSSADLPQARIGFCLNGWHAFRGNCYRLVNNPGTWSSAEAYCANFEGSLASAHSIWEYNFLQRLVKTGEHTYAWIGGYFFLNDWRWEDGTQFDYQKWGSVASTSSYQCLVINSEESKGWTNHGCTRLFPFVCQLRAIC